MSNEQQPNVKAHRTTGGWVIETDIDAWADLMTALSLAIDVCDQNGLPDEVARAARFRAIRTALSTDRQA